MLTTWKTLILWNLLLIAAIESIDLLKSGSDLVGSLFNLQNPSEGIWIRKMRTYFRRLDFDGDGVINRRDFERMADRFAEQQTLDPVAKEIARQRFSDLFSIFTKTEGTQDDVLLTEDLLIEATKMKRNDPAFVKIIVDFVLQSLIPMEVHQKGFFTYDEYSKCFEDVGFIDIVFTLVSFTKIDTDHDWKVSMAEVEDGVRDYLCSDDESSAILGLLA